MRFSEVIIAIWFCDLNRNNTRGVIIKDIISWCVRILCKQCAIKIPSQAYVWGDVLPVAGGGCLLQNKKIVMRTIIINNKKSTCCKKHGNSQYHWLLHTLSFECALPAVYTTTHGFRSYIRLVRTRILLQLYGQMGSKTRTRHMDYVIRFL